MKGIQVSEAQIAFVLKRAEDGSAVAEVCREAGISEAGAPTIPSSNSSTASSQPNA
ncbi:hypothetical protein ABIB00_007912 [Bradyrhizobium sp. LB14.3]|uniref:hypothetical protein n=1 Tax=Bradyrhizobium sp. LB14.3 TaxID=3156328 RepID=UPI00339A0F7C